jgi:hypothetical protein
MASNVTQPAMTGFSSLLVSCLMAFGAVTVLVIA